MSAFWIIALNSWMHTPQGFEMIDGVAHVTSWMEVIFNPSMPYRLTHMLLASGLTAAFLVAGVSAYCKLRNNSTPGVNKALKTGVFSAAVLIPLQIFIGDLHGLSTLEHQPAKIAAMEAIWETEKGAPLVLFALPDESTRSNRFEVSIPKLASLILTHDSEGELRGIESFGENRPPVAALFWSFRVMVGTGMLMLLISAICAWQLFRHNSLSPLMLRALVWMSFSGWIATLAGWYTTEIGRQPWLVQGVLTTAQAVAQTPIASVAGSLIMYLSLYGFLLVAYIATVFYLARNNLRPSPGAPTTGTAHQPPRFELIQGAKT